MPFPPNTELINTKLSAEPHEEERIFSFPPILGDSPKLLVLGSMPGGVSLDAAEYYAHPRNAFWSIMGSIIGFELSLPYQMRIEHLKAAHIALWDVLYSCKRKGSLDSDIQTDSIAVNDISGLLKKHPSISHIFFNGTKAESCFSKYILKKTPEITANLIRLPSTSPAHAALSFEQKYKIWEEQLSVCFKPY